MKNFVLLYLLLLSVNSLRAQSRYFTKAGKITFYSKSPLENIEAVNNKAVGVLDIGTGQIEFAVLMKGFEFEKALMQEHFNENYVESDKYPKAFFTGVIENSHAISLTIDNVTTVKVNGSLTLHGVTNPLNTTAVITAKNGVLEASSHFSIVLADYNISIPSIVADKINKSITVSVIIPAFEILTTK
jgi:hypothetical protein